jgi:hypothetical protein
MSLSRTDLLSFLRSHRYAVQSSTHATGAPQSAVVGVAVSDDFEVIFDTLGSTRKAHNLRERPQIALVFSGASPGDERTVQVEGIAEEPTGADRDRLVDLYLSVFPEGVERQSWAGLVYFSATPRWLRYADYGVDPPEIVEFDELALRKLE